MSNYGSNYRDQKSGSKIRGIFIAALLSFIAGGILTVWAAQRLEIFDGTKKAGANEPAEAEPAFESLTPSAAQTSSGPDAAQTATGSTSLTGAYWPHLPPAARSMMARRLAILQASCKALSAHRGQMT